MRAGNAARRRRQRVAPPAAHGSTRTAMEIVWGHAFDMQQHCWVLLHAWRARAGCTQRQAPPAAAGGALRVTRRGRPRAPRPAARSAPPARRSARPARPARRGRRQSAAAPAAAARPPPRRPGCERTPPRAPPTPARRMPARLRRPGISAVYMVQMIIYPAAELAHGGWPAQPLCAEPVWQLPDVRRRTCGRSKSGVSVARRAIVSEARAASAQAAIVAGAGSVHRSAYWRVGRHGRAPSLGGGDSDRGASAGARRRRAWKRGSDAGLRRKGSANQAPHSSALGPASSASPCCARKSRTTPCARVSHARAGARRGVPKSCSLRALRVCGGLHTPAQRQA